MVWCRICEAEGFVKAHYGTKVTLDCGHLMPAPGSSQRVEQARRDMHQERADREGTDRTTAKARNYAEGFGKPKTKSEPPPEPPGPAFDSAAIAAHVKNMLKKEK